MHAAPFTLPDPIGTVRFRFRIADLEWIEARFADDLDALNRRIIEGHGPVGDDGTLISKPFASVWDGIDPILSRSMMTGVRILVAAGIAHTFDGDDPDTQRDRALDALSTMPPSIYRDDTLTQALNVALGEAFGATPQKSGQTVPPPPPAPRVEAARS